MAEVKGDAMTNETWMEEVRERARKYYNGSSWLRDDVINFAQSEREAEMELCCKDVCQSCRW